MFLFARPSFPLPLHTIVDMSLYQAVAPQCLLHALSESYMDMASKLFTFTFTMLLRQCFAYALLRCLTAYGGTRCKVTYLCYVRLSALMSVKQRETEHRACEWLIVSIAVSLMDPAHPTQPCQPRMRHMKNKLKGGALPRVQCKHLDIPNPHTL